MDSQPNSISEPHASLNIISKRSPDKELSSKISDIDLHSLHVYMCIFKHTDMCIYHSHHPHKTNKQNNNKHSNTVQNQKKNKLKI